MPRIFLIHGWGGSSQSDWLPWATNELMRLGYKVFTPDMPNTDAPVISEWVDALTNLVGTPRSDDIFIGHSIGCQTILRYLERKDISKVGLVILVAPWFTLSNLDDQEAWSIADPWLKTPIDTNIVKSKAGKLICIFSDNDPWVPYQENKEMFEKQINPQIITLHNHGHITADEGFVALPKLLTLLK